MKNIVAIIAAAAVIIGCAFIFIIDISAHEVLVINDDLLVELSPTQADSMLEYYTKKNNSLLTDYFLNHILLSPVASYLPRLTRCAALDNIVFSGVCCLPAIESCIVCLFDEPNDEMLYILQLLIDEAAKINIRYKPYPTDTLGAVRAWNNYKSSIPEAVHEIIFSDEDNTQLLKYGYLAVPYILDAIDDGVDAHSVIEVLYYIIMYDKQMLGDILSGKLEVERVEIHIMFEKVNQWLEKSKNKIRLIRAIVDSQSEIN